MEEPSKECLEVTKNEKNSDSDVNSEDLSCSDEQNSVHINSSPFYESSDSKIDYAEKLDDNDTLSDIDDIKTDTASADSEDSALGSLPSDCALNDREEDARDRSDGSDSGLGSESPDDGKLPSFNIALPCAIEPSNLQPEKEEIDVNTFSSDNKQENVDHNSIQAVKKPLKSSLKRKYDFEQNDEPQVKKKKHKIQFDNVTVFYFPRAQGFTCVPSQGGSTLGMEWEHSHIHTFTLVEHALEQRRLHRQILQQIKSERHTIQGVSSLSSSEDSDTEEETSDISESELDLDSYYFLQPVPTRQRRALLRAAGVRKIEGYEKDECRDIRTSREFCGCACKGVCNPDNCSCSLAGIKCQVDRLNFPCGCTRDGCCNTTGRIEFNPMRVRTHFINTLMRIGLEKKNEENEEAAKRKWAETHSATVASCVSTIPYNKENCHNHAESAIASINLPPRLGMESCITGNFSNIHHTLNSSNSNPNDTFNFRGEPVDHRNLKINNMMTFEDKSDHRNHEPYTSNILQGKGPPYHATNTMEYNTMANNMQRYQCDLSYSYEQQYPDSHHFKGVQSFSAASFEEFAHNSQMSMLNHYGHMYSDYMQKPSTSMPEHTSMPYQSMSHNHYDMYKNIPDCVNTDNKVDSHYTTLMTMPYQQSNKLQAVENDENWFSHNTLLNLDHSVQVNENVPIIQTEQVQTLTEGETSDTTENFGELIKKTMVESVTV